MKKLLISLIVLIFCSSYAFADVSWHLANQTTVGWDSVTTLSDGTPIPSEQISYRIYIAKLTDKSDKIVVGDNIVSNTYTITLNSEGKWYVGAQAVRTVDNTIINSNIAWSDDPVSCQNGETFGIMLYLAPADIKGLKIVTTP